MMTSTFLGLALFSSPVIKYFALLFMVAALLCAWHRQKYILADHLSFLFLFLDDLLGTLFNAARDSSAPRWQVVLSGIRIRSLLLTISIYSSEFNPILFFIIKFLLVLKDFTKFVVDNINQDYLTMRAISKMNDFNSKMQSFNLMLFVGILDYGLVLIMFVDFLFTMKKKLLVSLFVYCCLLLPLLYCKKESHQYIWKIINEKVEKIGSKNEDVNKLVVFLVNIFQKSFLFVPDYLNISKN